MVYQISIYTENRKGALGALTRTLSEAGVNLLAFVTNESGEFGTVRMLADDDKAACAALAEAGYLTKRTQVLAVEIADRTGSLAQLLELVEAANLNIDYLYAAFDRDRGVPLAVLHAEDLEELESYLTGKGYRSLG